MRFLSLLLIASLSACATDGGPHGDAVMPVLLALLSILLVAKLGGELAIRLGQPSVLGELLAGVAWTTLRHTGVPLPDLESIGTLDVLAQLGVVVLLFEVGLESTVPQLLAVGGRATWIAILGVVAPIVGGFFAGSLLMPGAPWSKPLFLGAALCATSVGVTARVLKDLGASQTREARLIVGAAVIDDVLGLIVLSVVSGIALAATGGGHLDWKIPAMTSGLAALFLTGAIVLGPTVSKLAFKASTRLRSPDIVLPIALAFAFAFAFLAGQVGLAPIVGAYAAGLVLEEAHYKTLLDRGEEEIETLVRPIGQFLIPIFFVAMGSRVHLWAFNRPEVWLLALALIVIGVVSKLACALGAPKGTSRLLIGLGMIPRGEVGLIFADTGRRLVVDGRPLLDDVDFSAIVLMVAATTLLTPPLLGWLIRRNGTAAAPSDPTTGGDLVG